MNRNRRKIVKAALEEFMNTYTESREKLVNVLEEVMEEEQEAYDNLPEGIMESERGEAMQEALDALQGAIDTLEDDPEFVEELCDGLEIEME